MVFLSLQDRARSPDTSPEPTSAPPYDYHEYEDIVEEVEPPPRRVRSRTPRLRAPRPLTVFSS